MRVLALFISLLTATCFADSGVSLYGAGHGVAAVGGTTYPDILLFFTSEENDTTGTYDIDGNPDCALTDVSGTYGSLGTIAADGAIGSYSFNGSSTVDTLTFDWGTAKDPIVFAYFFKINDGTWPDTLDVGSVNFVNTTDARYIRLAPHNDGDTNEVNLRYRENGGAIIDISTDNANLALDTWYVVQVTINSGGPSRKIEIFNTSLSLLDSAENTSAFTAPTNGYETVDMNTGYASDLHIDNLMVSNSATRNFVTDEEAGTKLINLTAAPSGACQ